jgi:hypothetical protein
MVTKEQIKLMQVAAKAAGLRTKGQDGRYYLILAQYKTKYGKMCSSCTELNNWQIDDFLAICESLGWRYPGKSETYCRERAAAAYDADYASYAQRQAIDYLAGDLGMHGEPLKAFCLRMTRQRTDSILQLSPREAYVIIEALKAALCRQDGVRYESVADIHNYHTHLKEVEHGREEIETCPI